MVKIIKTEVVVNWPNVFKAVYGVCCFAVAGYGIALIAGSSAYEGMCQWEARGKDSTTQYDLAEVTRQLGIVILINWITAPWTTHISYAIYQTLTKNPNIDELLIQGFCGYMIPFTATAAGLCVTFIGPAPVTCLFEKHTSTKLNLILAIIPAILPIIYAALLIMGLFGFVTISIALTICPLYDCLKTYLRCWHIQEVIEVV